MIGVKKGNVIYIMLQKICSTLYLNYSTYYTHAMQNYKYYHTKLQTVLQKLH